MSGVVLRCRRRCQHPSGVNLQRSDSTEVDAEQRDLGLRKISPEPHHVLPGVRAQLNDVEVLPYLLLFARSGLCAEDADLRTDLCPI